ncbi:MAG TPA: hypothetical protein V6C85_34660 [Allocoleopsis sp.]
MWVKRASELTPEEKAELAQYLPQEIDVNTMADIFYSVCQNFTTLKEKYGKVEPWDIDSYVVKTFLLSLSNFELETSRINHKQIIPLDRVLSKPWNKWRLALALAHLEIKQTAPPIRVNAYKVEGTGSWYVAIDGVHRATAAKMMGYSEIQAEVIREIVLDCATIRKRCRKSPRANYLLEVLGIRQSLRGMLGLIWNLVKRTKSELED